MIKGFLDLTLVIKSYSNAWRQPNKQIYRLLSITYPGEMPNLLYYYCAFKPRNWCNVIYLTVDDWCPNGHLCWWNCGTYALGHDGWCSFSPHWWMLLINGIHSTLDRVQQRLDLIGWFLQQESGHKLLNISSPFIYLQWEREKETGGEIEEGKRDFGNTLQYVCTNKHYA